MLGADDLARKLKRILRKESYFQVNVVAVFTWLDLFNLNDYTQTELLGQEIGQISYNVAS